MDHLQPGQQGDEAQAQAQNHRLNGVEELQRSVGFDRRVGVARPRLLVLANHPAFGAEGLDRLVVHQGVDHEAGRLAVRLVQRPAMLDAPVRDGEGEGDVEDDGGDGHAGQAPVVVGGHHRRRHGQLEHRGAQIEHHAAQQEVRRDGAAVDDAGQAARLFRLVEVQRQRQRMGEGLHRRSGQGLLRDRREDGVADQGRGVGDEAQQNPPPRQTGEDGEQYRTRAAPVAEGVDGPADPDRRADPGPFAEQHEGERQDQTDLQPARAGAQDQPPEIGHRAPEFELRRRRRHRVGDRHATLGRGALGRPGPQGVDPAGSSTRVV